MRIEYRGSNFSVSAEAGDDFKKAFQFLALADETFSCSPCPNCGGTDHRLSFRQPASNPEAQYYSFVCRKDGWEFKLGQTKTGNRLFPKQWEPPYGGGSQAPVEETSESWT